VCLGRDRLRRCLRRPFAERVRLSGGVADLRGAPVRGGERHGPAQRNAEWDTAAFAGAGPLRNSPPNSCFGCHLQARAQQDFNFTGWDYATARR